MSCLEFQCESEDAEIGGFVLKFGPTVHEKIISHYGHLRCINILLTN